MITLDIKLVTGFSRYKWQLKETLYRTFNAQFLSFDVVANYLQSLQGDREKGYNVNKHVSSLFFLVIPNSSYTEEESIQISHI